MGGLVVILPWLGVLIYLIVEHDGTRQRSVKQAQAQRQEFDDDVRDTAGGGSAAEIAKAKELLESGAITQEEFEALKAKALAKERGDTSRAMAADAVEHGEEHDVGRWSHVAGSSRAFSRLTPIFVAREFRAAGVGAKRAAG